jgi:hypothetical protein
MPAMTKREIHKLDKLMAVMKAKMEQANLIYRELEAEVAALKRESSKKPAKRGATKKK